MAYGWEGEVTRLVPVDIDRHFENACAWINDPEVTHNLMVGDFPLTKMAERQWMENQAKPNESNIFFAIETLDGVHIGFSGFHDISWRHGTATTGSFIGEVGMWGKGYGSDAANIRNRYGFDVLGLRILYSSVFEGNTRSFGMLKKAGYVETGRWPKRYWKRGRYIDEILMYLDREAWLERSTKKE